MCTCDNHDIVVVLNDCTVCFRSSIISIHDVYFHAKWNSLSEIRGVVVWCFGGISFGLLFFRQSFRLFFFPPFLLPLLDLHFSSIRKAVPDVSHVTAPNNFYATTDEGQDDHPYADSDSKFVPRNSDLGWPVTILNSPYIVRLLYFNYIFYMFIICLLYV